MLRWALYFFLIEQLFSQWHLEIQSLDTLIWCLVPLNKKTKTIFWLFRRFTKESETHSEKYVKLCWTFPANIYLFKVYNSSTRKKREICSKLTIKRKERRHWRRSTVLIVNFKHISHIFHIFHTQCLCSWFWTSKC